MIYTFGREEIEAGLAMAEPYALISISSPTIYGFEGQARAQLFQESHHEAILPADENRLGILRLAFHDVDVAPSDLDDKLKSQIRLYSAEDARRVAAFVKAWTVNFVVHCDAGISRSQGMANAIGDHLDVDVKHARAGAPNRLVYKLTWDALRPAISVRRPSLTGDDTVLPTRRAGKTADGDARYRVVFKGDRRTAPPPPDIPTVNRRV